MATCIECGNGFLPTKTIQYVCQECIDFDVTDELAAMVGDDNDDDMDLDYEPDVDETQENEDFAHDDDFYNRALEDSWIDSEYEGRTDLGDFD